MYDAIDVKTKHATHSVKLTKPTLEPDHKMPPIKGSQNQVSLNELSSLEDNADRL